jgi:hypothetical protein
LVSQSLAGTTGVQPKTDEASLQTLQDALDREMSGQVSEWITLAQVETVAREFRVSPSLVQELQGSRQLWGEVAIELAMAQTLSKTNKRWYPTVPEALKRVQYLRGQSRTWGSLAKELGIPLAPVRRAVHSTLKELQVEKERLQHRLRAERAVDTASAGR